MSIKQVDSIPAGRGTARVFKRHGRNLGRIAADIVDFMDSDMSMCEVSTDGYSNARNAWFTGWGFVKRKGFPVRIAQRGERLFLIKTNEVDE